MKNQESHDSTGSGRIDEILIISNRTEIEDKLKLFLVNYVEELYSSSQNEKLTNDMDSLLDTSIEDFLSKHLPKVLEQSLNRKNVTLDDLKNDIEDCAELCESRVNRILNEDKFHELLKTEETKQFLINAIAIVQDKVSDAKISKSKKALIAEITSELNNEEILNFISASLVKSSIKSLMSRNNLLVFESSGSLSDLIKAKIISRKCKYEGDAASMFTYKGLREMAAIIKPGTLENWQSEDLINFQKAIDIGVHRKIAFDLGWKIKLKSEDINILSDDELKLHVTQLNCKDAIEWRRKDRSSYFCAHGRGIIRTIANEVGIHMRKEATSPMLKLLSDEELFTYVTNLSFQNDREWKLKDRPSYDEIYRRGLAGIIKSRLGLYVYEKKDWHPASYEELKSHVKGLEVNTVSKWIDKDESSHKAAVDNGFLEKLKSELSIKVGHPWKTMLYEDFVNYVSSLKVETVSAWIEKDANSYMGACNRGISEQIRLELNLLRKNPYNEPVIEEKPEILFFERNISSSDADTQKMLQTIPYAKFLSYVLEQDFKNSIEWMKKDKLSYAIAGERGFSRVIQRELKKPNS